MKKSDTKSLIAPVLLALTMCGCANTASSSESMPVTAAEHIIEAAPLSTFAGRWSPDCEKIGGIHIYENNNMFIEVNSNQIYIRSHGEQNRKALSVFFDEPDDLGRGGMMLPWSEYSNERPIARMILGSEDNSLVYWYGFYNKETGSYEWAVEPDFLGDTMPVIFNKCK